MASSLHFLLIILFSLFLVSHTNAKSHSKKPPSLAVPISRDTNTNLFFTFIMYRRTPSLRVQHVVDLNGGVLWETCDQRYVSSTLTRLPCKSADCAKISGGRQCLKDVCGLSVTNPVTQQAVVGEAAHDLLSVLSTNGSKVGPLLTVPRFTFACVPGNLLSKGLPSYVHGVAGFAQTPLSLPNQLASHLGFSPKFAVCLSSSTSRNGAIFFGDGPFFIDQHFNVSARLFGSTPLVSGPKGEYYLPLESIDIRDERVAIKQSLPSRDGSGGTTISTTEPYTILESSIYNSFIDAFAKAVNGTPQVAPVKPFNACYDTKRFRSTYMGPLVPTVDLKFTNGEAKCMFFGINSMVEARPGVQCLAFVDGGPRRGQASVVIGAYQMVDYLVEFGLAKKRLQFTSSLRSEFKTCADFDFSV